MAKVKLDIRGLSIPERVARYRQIITALTGNPNFPNSQALLTEFTDGVDGLETAFATAQADRQTSKQSTSVLHEKDDSTEAIARRVGAFVESAAGDDEPKILSASMNVRSAATSATIDATAPTGLSASEGDHDGEIDLTNDRVKGAKSYVYERSFDPPTATSWVHAAVSPTSSVTISGLASGTRYWFRVAAVMSTGGTGWSDPASKIAP